MASVKALCSVLLFVVCVSSQAWAQEASWNKTFVPESVGTYLPAGRNDLLIAAAGDNSTNLTTAAKALENALRQSGRAGLVMDSASLGPLAGLDDARIVKKTNALPVNRVAVLRVFPAGPGEPWRAVVTLYDKTGKVLGAFSAVAGSPLEKAGEESTSSPAEGVSAQAANEVAAQVATHREGSSKAQETYDRFFIGFDDWAAVSQTGRMLHTWSQPWQGKYKQPLDGADFYRAVGRKDLADKYTSAQNTKIVISTMGVLAVMVGLYLTFDSVNDMSSSDEPSGWSDKATLGLVLSGVGGMAAWLPWLASSHPVDAPEARRLADEHNQKLKSKLGLSMEETSPSRKASNPGSRLTLSPAAFASPTGAVLGVVGRY